MKTRELTLVSLFVALTAAGAFVKIPLAPVPISLQTLFVMLAGVVLGAKLGALSQAAYVILGLLGLPIFTAGGGPGYILQPSFGYLIGFIFGAYITGKTLEGSGRGLDRGRGALRVFLAVLAGLLAVYICGVGYLYFLLNFVIGKGIALSSAIKVGFLVFLPGDLAKAAVVALVGNRLRRVLIS